jgi:peptide/nickel transport system permease protein
MTLFIIRRIQTSVIVLVLVSLFVFFAMRLLPGDPIKMLIIDESGYSEERVAQLRHEFGLDRPMIVQYFSWIGGLFKGEMGVSIVHRTPVENEILRRLPVSIFLGSMALAIGILFGLPAGIISAVRRGKRIDPVVVTFTNIGITVPVFWLGFILIYLFGLKLAWLPVQGFTSPFTDLGLFLKQSIMPVCCLAVFPLCSMTRQTRSSMLEIIGQDYMRTAWSKGLREQVIILRHGLKNALIPIITVAGMMINLIIGGTVIIETVFNIPGMGRLAVSSVMNQDYPYVQGIILVIAIGVILVNLIIDLAYGLLDPRIRYEANGKR